MPYQNVSATLDDADIQEIKTALQTIEQKLPFLITLTADERRKLFKMGDKSLTFVSNSLTAAQSNPDILPASFDLEEFRRDYQLITTLTDIFFRLQQLTEKVDDTLMAVSSEAMSSSLSVYDYVKAAAKKTPGLKTVAEQLGERFKAIRNKPAKSPSDSWEAKRLVAEEFYLINESFFLASEFLHLIDESFLLVSESQNLIEESFLLVSESQNLINESFWLASESKYLIAEG